MNWGHYFAHTMLVSFESTVSKSQSVYLGKEIPLEIIVRITALLIQGSFHLYYSDSLCCSLLIDLLAIFLGRAKVIVVVNRL